MNRVQLVGWLGKDMEVKTAKNGQLYAKLRMATDRVFDNREGEKVKATVWHTVWIWDSDIVADHKDDLVSGSHIMVEGSIGYRIYTDANGRFNHIMEIKASSLIDLDR